MSRQKYTHVQALFPEIRAIIATGKTQGEIAEHFSLRDKYVVTRLLARERRKEEKIKTGIMSRSKGRPRKTLSLRDLFDNSIIAYKTETTQSVNLVLDTIRFAMQKEK